MIYRSNDITRCNIKASCENDRKMQRMRKNKDTIVYYPIYCGFDIETTNYIDEDNRLAFMYHWQFSINNDVYLGRTWSEYDNFILLLTDILGLGTYKRIIVWVANLGYEFQFIRKRIEVMEIFAKERRQPLTVTTRDGIEYHECLSISGGSLKQLAKNYTKTQKMVGDLDYSVPRHYATPLTEKEEKYCINDVVILSEWSAYIWDNYIYPEHYCPITKTQIINKEIKNALNEYYKTKRKDRENTGVQYINKVIKYYHPKEALYNLMMRYLYRGGWNHANILYTTKTITNMGSYDIQSSYPSTFFNYFPLGLQMVPENKTNIEYVEKFMDTHCIMFIVTFEHLVNITTQTYESKHKCMELVNPIVDNGRVMQADKIKVFLTELDYKLYKLFYTWKSAKVECIYISNKIHLPAWIVKPMAQHYIKKTDLKEEHLNDMPEYKIEKEKVNSFYGLMVKRFIEQEIVYINEEWGNEDPPSFESQMSKAILLPQWGIYICAHARYKECSMAVSLGCDNVYGDTDSLKFKNPNKHKPKFESANDIIRQNNKEACKFYGLPEKYFADIGTWDYEGDIKKFKTLGCKRYLYTDADGIDHATIAGLPKQSLLDYAKENNVSIYRIFKDKVSIFKTNKLMATYNDNYTMARITDNNGVSKVMEEYTSTNLSETTFTCSMETAYTQLILDIQENKKYTYNKSIGGN